MVPLPPNVFTRILIPVACTKYLVFFYENFCQEETSTKRSSFLNRYFHVIVSQLHLIIIGCRTEIFDMEKIMIKLFKSGIVPAPIRGSAQQLYAVQQGSLKSDLYKDIELVSVFLTEQ
jgi:hypothetical protein